MTVPGLLRLNWEMLRALRTLAYCRDRPAADFSLSLVALHLQAQDLRALGLALEQPYGRSWNALVECARAELRAARDQHVEVDSAFYSTILITLIALRYAPTDLRLARPGLGQKLIELAICLEHWLVLPSEAGPPPPPRPQPVVISPRDELLLEVARRFAVLYFAEQLPCGHRLTFQELAETGRSIRAMVDQKAGEQGQDLTQIWAKAAQRLTPDSPSQRPQDVLFGLSLSLHSALLAQEDCSEGLADDAVVALSLEHLAATLEPPYLTQLDWLSPPWTPV